MDDFSVYGQTFPKALDNLENVLKRCQEANFTLSHEKCRMMFTKGVVLGHIFSQARIEVDPAKISVISNLSPPKNQKEIRSFLGHARYYRRFIKNFTKLATPLFKLLVKDVNFIWEDSCQKAFEDLKLKLSETPILRGPNWTFPFHISTDAFDSTLGVVLGQKEEQLHYAIYFISKNLTPAELSYTVIEKEFLAVIFAINKFRHYIIGYEVFVHTDHSTIRYLMNKPITNGRVTRWLLLL